MSNEDSQSVEAVINRAEEMREAWTNSGQCARERCTARQYFGEDFRGYAASPHQRELACWIAIFRGEGVDKAEQYFKRAEDKDQLFKKVKSAIREAGYVDEYDQLLFSPPETSIGSILPYVLAHLEVVHNQNISGALAGYREELIDNDPRWDGYRADI